MWWRKCAELFDLGEVRLPKTLALADLAGNRSPYSYNKGVPPHAGSLVATDWAITWWLQFQFAAWI